MKVFFPCWEGSNLILGIGKENQIFVYQMGRLCGRAHEYQALRPHCFSVGGWLEGSRGGVGGVGGGWGGCRVGSGGLGGIGGEGWGGQWVVRGGVGQGIYIVQYT